IWKHAWLARPRNDRWRASWRAESVPHRVGASEVTWDFDLILDHLASHEVKNPVQRTVEIIAALYRYVPEMDTVFVFSIRSQREAGHAERKLHWVGSRRS
ncbi:MAG: hypothetical protein Q8K01_10725, partial [Sulfurimicrobium sp.]|nr:hypothetical protein [Sulfurimicrobium sp.]